MKPTLIIILLLLSIAPAQGEFDIGKYLLPPLKTMGKEIFYPEYLRRNDPVTFTNIFEEFKLRYEYFSGLMVWQPENVCFKKQGKINKRLDQLAQSGELEKFKWLDDELLFNTDSPLASKLRISYIKPSESCSFVSYGEPGRGGIVFCKYHGPDPSSEFYAQHIHEFTQARPFITAYDITEMLILIPFLLVIPFSWWIMKKFLSAKS